MTAPDTETRNKPESRRSTFLSGREILERSRSTLHDVCEALQEMPRDGDRTALLCQSLEALQRDLSQALGHFFETVPGKTLDERTQYTVEMPVGLDRADPPENVEEALDWSLALTDSLVKRFRELSRSAVAESLREGYENLAELITGYQKRIARMAEGHHDL